MSSPEPVATLAREVGALRLTLVVAPVATGPGPAAPAGRGNALRGARRATGMTLRQFADRIGVSVSCASRWETDVRRPHIDDLRRIALTLGQPVAEVQCWFSAPLLSTERLRDPRGLRSLRIRAGLSRAELGAAANVSVATVAHWECGRRSLPAQRWTVVAGAVGLDVVDFVSAARAGRDHRPPRPLAQLRRRRKLTQRQVATSLGVSASLISRWERGSQSPGWPHVRSLAEVLDAPLHLVAAAAGRSGPAHLDRSRWHDAPLGPVLRQVRTWRGEHRAVIARRVGVHPDTLQRWEAGATRPPEARVAALEVALGLPADSLPRPRSRAPYPT